MLDRIAATERFVPGLDPTARVRNNIEEILAEGGCYAVMSLTSSMSVRSSIGDGSNP